MSKNDYIEIEQKPTEVINQKYVFVYLLGINKNYVELINEFACKHNLKIITIPYANEKYNEYDEFFGNYKINDCSPENWLWLIHNAEYIFTDSFHAIVFSTIFEKKFVVLKREYKYDINNRLNDYLSVIDENNKLISDLNNFNINDLVWDYKKINKRINCLKKDSINFLSNALQQYKGKIDHEK